MIQHYFCNGSCKTIYEKNGLCDTRICKQYGRDLVVCDCIDNNHKKDLPKHDKVIIKSFIQHDSMNAVFLGISVGCVWGSYLFLTALLSWYWGIGTPILHVFASLYFGYSANLLGGIIGFVWGFCDGFITGVLVAWLYNVLQRRKG